MRQANPSLLTPTEQAFHRVLLDAVGLEFLVMSKVRLADVLQIGKSDLKLFNATTQKHVDFVLCDPATTAVKLAVELDDSSHRRPDRQARDRFVDEVFATKGIPILHVPVAASYNPLILRARIDRVLESTPPPLPNPVIFPKAEPLRPSPVGRRIAIGLGLRMLALVAGVVIMVGLGVVAWLIASRALADVTKPRQKVELSQPAQSRPWPGDSVAVRAPSQPIILPAFPKPSLPAPASPTKSDPALDQALESILSASFAVREGTAYTIQTMSGGKSEVEIKNLSVSKLMEGYMSSADKLNGIDRKAVFALHASGHRTQLDGKPWSEWKPGAPPFSSMISGERKNGQWTLRFVYPAAYRALGTSLERVRRE